MSKKHILSREEVIHIARLARVGITDEEIERFRDQLSHILENFELLKRVDTSNVPPTTQPNPLSTIVKEDAVKPSMDHEEVLANAPARHDEFFKIRPVLES